MESLSGRFDRPDYHYTGARCNNIDDMHVFVHGVPTRTASALSEDFELRYPHSMWHTHVQRMPLHRSVDSIGFFPHFAPFRAPEELLVSIFTLSESFFSPSPERTTPTPLPVELGTTYIFNRDYTVRMAFTSLVLMLGAGLFLSLQATVFAQTFPDYPLTNTWPGLSSACLTALNTTVQCSGLLPLSAER